MAKSETFSDTINAPTRDVAFEIFTHRACAYFVKEKHELWIRAFKAVGWPGSYTVTFGATIREPRPKW